MKSKKLIELLQSLDPTGEVEVSVNNADILYVESLPAYYDGSLQVLIRDESKKPYYDIVGAKYVRTGGKIVIHPMSITDLLWDDPDASVDYSQLSGWSLEKCTETNEKTRQASLDVEIKVDMDAFFKWVKKKTSNIYVGNGVADCLHEANRFYTNHLNPKDPVKDLPATIDKDGNKWCASWSEQREAMWDDTIDIKWEGEWVITKKEIK
jgi:hypothetical protein